MGRPLNKKFFGSPAQPGKHVVMTSAWVPGEVGPAEGFYVVRQVGTGRYQVTNGSVVGVVRLADAGPLAAGEAHLVINPAGDNADEYAKVIHNRSIKTWEGNNYKWDQFSGTEVGTANIFDGPTPPPPAPPEPAPAPAPVQRRAAAKPADTPADAPADDSSK
jgi:hypothetical protein